MDIPITLDIGFFNQTFMPHGHCFFWMPSLVALHVGSDLLIAFSYFLIPIGLCYFIKKRQDLPFDFIFVCFGAFIFSCGITHLMNVWTLWHANYWISGFIKAFTALISLLTAIVLIRFIPRALSIPSPSMLRDANEKLQREINTRTEAEEKLYYLAYHDALTGLPNRFFFEQNMEKFFADNHDKQIKIAVLFIDLDQFKQVNDILGHQAGDKVLQEVAARLLALLNTEDFVARLSGDEFVLVMGKYKTKGDIKELAKKILSSLSAPFLLNDETYFLTASIGISTFPDNGSTLKALMKNSDIALYLAKEIGKNTFSFTNKERIELVENNAKIGIDLHEALKNDQFVLLYQPKDNLKTNQISGFEALIRWAQKEDELVLPKNFIPISEENGLIIPLGEWVLQTACKQIKIWQSSQLSYPVSINVSSRQLQGGNIVELIKGMIDQYNIPPGLLEVEITETVLMNDIAKSRTLLKTLKDIGVCITIDDFGTGHSSFNYLRRLEIDKIKIDVSYIENITLLKQDAIIVNSIISMAHSLGITVVAEGVETEHQLSLLKDFQCDEIQGFKYSRPLAAANIPGFIKANKKL